jgi:hypothetical protein
MLCPAIDIWQTSFNAREMHANMSSTSSLSQTFQLRERRGNNVKKPSNSWTGTYSKVKGEAGFYHRGLRLSNSTWADNSFYLVSIVAAVEND